MLDYHKFSTVVRQAGGRPITNVSVTMRETTTQTVIVRYADGPTLGTAAYFNFPYVSTDGVVEFYVPSGTYDIVFTAGDRVLTMKNHRIGKLIGYNYQSIAESGFYWNRTAVDTTGALISGVTLTMDRYTSDSSLSPYTFLDSENNPVSSLTFDKSVTISADPGVYRITMSVDGEPVLIDDREEIGCYEGTPNADATVAIWGTVGW